MVSVLKKISLLLFFPMLLATGCVSDEIPVSGTPEGDGEQALVKLELQIPGQTRSFPVLQEDAVNEVDILVFDRNDKFFDWRHGSIATDGTTVNAILISSARGDNADKYRIVVFANARDRLRTLFGAPASPGQRPGGTTLNGHKNETYAAVMALITGTITSPVPDASKGIPMWGELNGKKRIEHGQLLGNLTLYRALARIDIGTYKGAIPNGGVTSFTALGNFKIEEVQIHNAPNKYRYAPLAANFTFPTSNTSIDISAPSPASGATPTVVKTAAADLITSGTEGVGFERALYMGEADVKMGNGTYSDNNHLNRPCIIVKGYYKPEGAASFNTAPSFYRIDFVTDATTHALHDVLRNYTYQVIISAVGGPGKGDAQEALKSFDADMTVVVKSWSNAIVSGTVIDGDKYIKATPYDFDIDKWGKVNEPVVIETNAPVVSGKSWSATVQPITSGGDISWIRLNPSYTSGISGGELRFTTDQVPNGSLATFSRSAKLRIVAGTMNYNIIVTQTGDDGEHLLRLSYSELFFAGRMWDEDTQTWVDPAPQTITVNWGPRNRGYDMSLANYTGGGVDIDGMTAGVTNTNINDPEVIIAPEAISDTDPHVAADPFFERSSRITVKAYDQLGGNPISKTFIVRQVYYSIVVTGQREYYFQNKSASVFVKANTPWVAEIVDGVNSDIFAANPERSSAGVKAGENFNFTLAANATPGKVAKIRFSSPDNLFPPQVVDIVVQDELPNCYIVAPNGTLAGGIPVRKAYRVWRYDRDLKDIFPTTPLATGTGTARVKLLWQDVPNMVTATLSGSGENAIINITANGGPGNAVVAYQINGVTYWSWHIWVTDKASLEAGVVTSDIGNFTLMDRNLGAVNNIPGDVGFLGLLYQRERKDPLSAPATYATTANTHPIRPIYPATGTTPLANNATEGFYAASTSPEKNFHNSIHHPEWFYYCSYGETSWYGALVTPREEDTLWGQATIKRDFDPCPEGWRVIPNVTLTSGVATHVYNSTKKCSFWQNTWWPQNGRRDYMSKSALIAGHSTSVFFMTASVMSTLEYGSGVPTYVNSSRHAFAAPVRCIKY